MSDMHATFRGHFFDDVRAGEAECGRAWESPEARHRTRHRAMVLGRLLLAATGGDGGEEGIHGASRALLWTQKYLSA